MAHFPLMPLQPGPAAAAPPPLQPVPVHMVLGHQPAPEQPLPQLLPLPPLPPPRQQSTSGIGLSPAAEVYSPSMPLLVPASPSLSRGMGPAAQTERQQAGPPALRRAGAPPPGYQQPAYGRGTAAPPPPPPQQQLVMPAAKGSSPLPASPSPIYVFPMPGQPPRSQQRAMEVEPGRASPPPPLAAVASPEGGSSPRLAAADTELASQPPPLAAPSPGSAALGPGTSHGMASAVEGPPGPVATEASARDEEGAAGLDGAAGRAMAVEFDAQPSAQHLAVPAPASEPRAAAAAAKRAPGAVVAFSSAERGSRPSGEASAAANGRDAPAAQSDPDAGRCGPNDVGPGSRSRGSSCERSSSGRGLEAGVLAFGVEATLLEGGPACPVLPAAEEGARVWRPACWCPVERLLCQCLPACLFDFDLGTGCEPACPHPMPWCTPPTHPPQTACFGVPAQLTPQACAAPCLPAQPACLLFPELCPMEQEAGGYDALLEGRWVPPAPSWQQSGRSAEEVRPVGVERRLGYDAQLAGLSAAAFSTLACLSLPLCLPACLRSRSSHPWAHLPPQPPAPPQPHPGVLAAAAVPGPEAACRTSSDTAAGAAAARGGRHCRQERHRQGQQQQHRWRRQGPQGSCRWRNSKSGLVCGCLGI